MKDCAILAESSKSVGLKKDNTMRQFNYRRVLGVPTASGFVPIIFHVALRPKKCCDNGKMKRLEGYEGVRAVVYLDGTYEDSCYWYDECRHDIDCEYRKQFKFDGLEKKEVDVPCHARSECLDPWEEEKETHFERRKGVADVKFKYHKTYYTGNVMHKAQYTLKPCTNQECCYGYKQEEVEEKPPTTPTPTPSTVIHRKINTGCACGRK